MRLKLPTRPKRERQAAGSQSVVVDGQKVADEPEGATAANPIGRPEKRPSLHYECGWYRKVTGDGTPLFIYYIAHVTAVFGIVLGMMFAISLGWHFGAITGAVVVVAYNLALRWIRGRVFVTVNTITTAGPRFWSEPLREWWDHGPEYWVPNEDTGGREILGFANDDSWRGLADLRPCGQSLLQVQGYSSSDFYEDLDNSVTKRRKERRRGGVTGRQQVSLALLAGTAIALFLVAASD